MKKKQNNFPFSEQISIINHSHQQNSYQTSTNESSFNKKKQQQQREN